jgi:23S rRNA (adenine2030-N6)-methyltransferase
VRLAIRPFSADPRLDGCGMVVVNPPYILEAEMRTLLPVLRDVMAEQTGSAFGLEWLAADQGSSPSSVKSS